MPTLILWASLIPFISPKPNYNYDEITQTLTINACTDGSASCTITQTEFRNSGPYTSYKIIDIKFGPTSIESQAFLECSNLIEIKISSSINSIAVPFCRRCPNIKKFVVDQSLYFETDEYGTLYSTNKVKLIRAPPGVTSVTIDPKTQIICVQAFQQAAYSSLKIPSNITEIHSGCFYDGNIKTIIFEGQGSIKSLSDEAMAIQFAVTSIKFSPSLEVIGKNSLRDCRSLRSVSFGENSNLTTISEGGFSSCTKLVSIVLPDKVRSVSDSAFAGCVALKTVHLSLALENLSSSAFSGCSSLSSITITDGNKNFISENGSFFDSGKTTAYLIAQNTTIFDVPDSLITIGATSLQSCPYLVELNVSKTHPKYAENRELLIDSKSKVVLAFIGGLESFQIPADTLGLGPYAASMLTKIKHIEIPNMVKYIDEYCFSGSSLESIILSSSITELRKCAFTDCTKLVNVTFPESGAIKIMHQSFMRTTNLGKIDCRCSITSFEYKAFCGSGIKELYFRRDGFSATGDYILSNTLQLKKVEFPSSLETLAFGSFQTSSVQYVSFGSSSKLRNVKCSAFQGCQNLTELSFGNQLSSIKENAFSSCTSLTKIVFDDNCPLTSITLPNIFFRCSSLKYIVLPRYISSIDPASFSNCELLLEVNASANSDKFESNEGILYTKDNQLVLCPQGKPTAEIKDGITSVGPRCFYQCTKLQQLIFPGTSKFNELTENMFYGCSNLKMLSIPKSIETVADGAFTGCTNLTTIQFGSESRLSNLTKGAFSSLTSLESINLDVCAELKNIPESCFLGCVCLKKISLPKSLSVTRKSSFKDCTSLSSVTFSPGKCQISIEESSFEGCSSLESIVFPFGCTSIGVRAFFGTGLCAELTIPKNVTFIGSEAFVGTHLRHVKYCGISELPNSAFGSQKPIVHVPFEYLFNSCLGTAPKRDLDDGCFIQTPLLINHLPCSTQFATMIVIDDDL